ncbi:MAG: hypothetical protein GWO20_02725 [Candidatus Korarchaeota archaeon]|nr:hypothetical protein [Candidatus Korarchaeota archaeon]NIU82382.1 hypothetical protein [Candidatus Thorarchaeota archaeon]NIW12849.1 hypothetical protein [Candidatus Thorarchaeota archaeon]NIW51050.1 hypothetical protein [Candidatus Korarchaeota archaeon]
MKKKALIILLVIFGGLVLLPVAMYGGLSVDVIKGTFSLTTTPFSSPASSSELIAMQWPVNLTTWNLDLKNKSMNVWQYGFTGITGRNKVNEEDSESPVKLSITFVIKKDGETVQEINIGVTHGDGTHEVTMLLGPGEGLENSGKYEIYITISLSIHTSHLDFSRDIELGPFIIHLKGA